MGSAPAVTDASADVAWVDEACAALRTAVAGVDGEVVDVVRSVVTRARAVAVHLPDLGPLAHGTTLRLIPLMEAVYRLARDYAIQADAGMLGAPLERGRRPGLDLRTPRTLGDAYVEQMRQFDADVAELARCVALIRGEETLAEAEVIASTTPNRWTRDDLLAPNAAPTVVVVDPEPWPAWLIGVAVVVGVGLVLLLLHLLLGGTAAGTHALAATSWSVR